MFSRFFIGRQSFIFHHFLHRVKFSRSWSNRSTSTVINELNEINVSEESIQKYQELNLKGLKDVYNKTDFQHISTQEGQHLLQCCGTSLITSTPEERNNICNSIYENLLKHDKLDLNIYYTYIQICTENRTLLNSKFFLESLKFKPDYKIYRLLLENVCECEDTGQAFQLLENMKSDNVTIDEHIFNSLVLVHTVKGGLGGGENVLETMKAAKVPETDETYFAILKGVIRSQNYNDFIQFLDKYKFNLDENQILVILKELGLIHHIEWLSEMKEHLSNLVPTREFINEVKNICIHLIHLKKSNSAVKLYTYVQQQPEVNYGFFILEEMLHSKTDTNEIINATKIFLENYNNERAFENLAEFAMKNEYFDITWKLFENFRELRPHFFWPLLIDARNNKGEIGIFEVIEKVNNMNLKLDMDTLEHYVLPYINLEEITTSVEKLKKVGFTVTETLSPMLSVLLKNGHIHEGVQLCGLYNVKIQGEKLFKSICSSWRNSKDTMIVPILQKFCEHSNVDDDLIGDFLVKSFQNCRKIKDYRAIPLLLKVINESNLKITTTSADVLREILDKNLKESEPKLSEEILDGIDRILEFKLKSETDYISHPRDMNLDDLENHLIELRQKNMETRGVLRKLIHLHAKMGNLKRVTQLRQEFLDCGYEETLGMKSSLMHNYIKSNNLELAFDLYEEIKNADSNFFVDHHKIIDLATLFAKNQKLDEAINLLNEAGNLRGYEGSGLQRNCVALLNSIEDENRRSEVLNILVINGYCKYNNIMLGPLVRIHLNRGDLEKASETYIHLTEKFKCTPLQFELTREIAKSKNDKLLQKVLASTSQIHGPLSAQVTLIGVLAEIGEEQILKKMLSSTQLDVRREINKKCIRWIKEGKSEALETLAKCCSRLSSEVIDLNFVYDCIMKTYALKNDCQGAIRFYDSLLDNDVLVDRSLEQQVLKLLRQNNYSIPTNFRINSTK